MTSTNAITNVSMTAKEFKQNSYNGYLDYVAMMEGKHTLGETVSKLSPLFAACGITLTMDNAASILTVAMSAVGTDKGERARKIKSITTFRALLKKGTDKGGWDEIASLNVHSNAGKDPSKVSTKPMSKAKGLTKDELLAEVESLRAQIAAISNAKTDAKTDAITAA